MSFEGDEDRVPPEGGPAWEYAPTRTPARPEACTFNQHYGYWEQFAPECARFALRFPRNNAKFREAFFWAIHRQDGFWADQFQSRVRAGSRLVQDKRSEVGCAESVLPETQPKRRKTGPKPDLDTAARVAEIVACVAPDGDWRSKFNDICEALHDQNIPFPKRWCKNPDGAADGPGRRATQMIGCRAAETQQKDCKSWMD
jgi:hypothetical protein